MWDRINVEVKGYAGTYLKRKSLRNGLNSVTRDA